MKLEKNIVFFDLETTGTNTQNDRIVEICAIKLKTDGSKERFYSLVDPTIEIPEQASEIHGITKLDLIDAPTFVGIGPEVLEFFKDCDIAGYNSNQFDVPMLFKEFERIGLVVNWEYNLLDVCLFERKLNSNKLTDVYKRRFGKEIEQAHTAEADVEATIDVFIDQMVGRTESVQEIDLMLQGEKKRVDIGGKLYRDSNGVLKWTFGKNIDKPIFSDINYLNWVMISDFPEETKNIIIKESEITKRN